MTAFIASQLLEAKEHESLDQLELRQAAFVAEVRVPAHTPEWRDWLEEIGFIPGEPVQVLTRGMPGADPLVVRVGDSTFALRKAEAQCIKVTSSLAPELKAAA